MLRSGHADGRLKPGTDGIGETAPAQIDRPHAPVGRKERCRLSKTTASRSDADGTGARIRRDQRLELTAHGEHPLEAEDRCSS